MQELQDAFSGLMTGDHEDKMVFRIYQRKSSSTSSKSTLAANIKLYNNFLKDDLAGIIWQKDVFNMRIIQPEESINDSSDACVGGELRFGDNIEDEWFVVYLLAKLSRHFSDICVTVRDNDGEFLLIETAAALPEWLTPDTCTNRVFLYNGCIHIVPQEVISTTKNLTLDQGMGLVFDGNVNTEATDNVQRLFSKRIIASSETTKSSNHVAHAYLPAGIRAILEVDPQLVSEAVEAICTSDPLEMRACKKMDMFSPLASVYCNVVFSRCLYAQLCHTKFVIPKVFGPEPSNNSPRHEPYILGAKLACGFELLITKAQKARKKRDISTGSVKLYKDIGTPNVHKVNAGEMRVDESSVEWKTYIKGLTSRGYFRNEMTGSKLYRELFEKAKESFLGNRNCEYGGIDAGGGPGAASDADTDVNGIDEDMLRDTRIIDILNETDVSTYYQKHRNSSLDTLDPEDSTDWLNITSEQLEAQWQDRLAGATLGNAYEHTASSTSGVDEHENADTGYMDGGDNDVQGMMDSLKHFVMGQVSEFDGVVVPDSPMSVAKQKSGRGHPTSSATTSSKQSKVGARSKDDFVAEDFFTHLRSILGQVGNENVEGFNNNNGNVDGGVDWRKTMDDLDEFLGSDTSDSEVDDYDKSSDDNLNSEDQANGKVRNRVQFTEMEEYYDDMQRELSSTRVNESFVLQKNVRDDIINSNLSEESGTTHSPSTEELDDGEGLRVDVNVNLLKNMLDSFESQQGLAGPASIIMESLGHRLPKNDLD
eukprot:CFRG7973T1